MRNNDRIVYRRDDGKWVNKKVEGEQASSLHDTQQEAQAIAREMLKNAGGGELITNGLDGKIRSKDTVSPGNDPRSSKG